jgi:hypothetical protein
VIFGLDLDLFWRSSIKTIALCLDARAAAARNEHNERVILAYNIAYLSRVKRLSPRSIEKMMARERTSKRQTWQEGLALMMQWEAAVNAKKAARNVKES